jgi:HEAT repeat protein
MAVILSLEAPTADRRPKMWRMRYQAMPHVLAAALDLAEQSLTRQLIADLLGFQAAPQGVPPLLRALRDPSAGVRSSAADALGKIMWMRGPESAPGAAEALRGALQDESDPAMRRMLESALGARPL